MKKILVKLKKRTLISIPDIFFVKFTKQCTPNFLAILLIFFKKESSKIVGCHKAFFKSKIDVLSITCYLWELHFKYENQKNKCAEYV